MNQLKIFKALIISPKNIDVLDIYNPGYMVVKNDQILDISQKDLRLKYPNAQFFDYSQYLILPGFIDLHNHLPQYAFVGIGENELLPWLEKYTFPREKQFANPTVVENASRIFFQDLIKNGTTTVVSYVTIHPQACEIAFQQAKKAGIRAFLGKVMMDQNCPDYLKENTNQSLSQAEKLINQWHGRNNRLFYILTPRFAVSCSEKLLKGVAQLSQKKQVYIQSHLSENKEEVNYIKQIFPQYINYTDVYYQTGLLGAKTIMAHCIHLNEEEINLLYKTKTNLSHCPTSNRFLQSGIMPYLKYIKAGLNIGLGTDVAGGYSLSMLHEMREAIENSKLLALFFKEKRVKPLTVAQALYSATLAGAKILGLEQEVGSLEKGKQADFIVIDYLKADPFGPESQYLLPSQILSRLIYRGRQKIIKEVYIAGLKVNQL